jgi:hypothetical protein
LLTSFGFEVKSILGVCEMRKTAETGKFCYEDFVFGAPISSRPEIAYITYVQALKPSLRGRLTRMFLG